MKRKFSFDIPKLKFGPLKQETQALKDHLASKKSFDSEPPSPKSVRPPLASVTEAELKAACTWIVANYRPSHIPYHQGQSVGVSAQAIQHVDYAAINAAVRREMAGEMQTAVQWPSIPSDQARIDQNGSQWPSSDMFRYKPTESSTDLFHQDELEAMRKQRSSIMAKADELMANLEETQKVLLSPEIRLSHSRTTSNQSALSLPLRDAEQRAHVTLRSDSAGTNHSTPRTDITGSAWIGSTNPTTAYVTPTSQSKRTSHTQSDTHLPPRVTPVDAEWMRIELERHLKAQEEELIRQESPVQEAAAGLAETTPTQIAEIPISPTSIQRKPVPRRGTGESQNFSLRTNSRQTQPHSRTVSHSASMPTSPFEKPRMERPSTSGKASANESKCTSYTKSTTRDAQNLVRPSTAQTSVMADGGVYHPRSRAQSTKGNVQNFSRPSIDVTSRKASPSPDISRPGSRARSVDSFRSAVSSLASSVGPSSKSFRYSLGRRRSLDSDVSADSFETRVSEASRGRPRMPRHSPPPPPINLLRETPPLPGLDQWKPVQAKTSSPTQETFVKGDEQNDCGRDTQAQLPPFPQRQDSLVNRRPAQPLHQSSLASPATSNFQARQTVYFDAEPSQTDEQPLAPANTGDPAVSPGWSSQSRERHRRSRMVMDAVSPDLVNHMSQVSLGQVGGEQIPSARPLNSAVHASADKRHSRKISGGAEARNFSRKLSADDYSRMYDSRYQNMLEVTPPQSHGSGNHDVADAPYVAMKERSKSKTKRHWWQGKQKREETWMDTVIKSGSKSGVLLTDEVAGAPIVRY